MRRPVLTRVLVLPMLLTSVASAGGSQGVKAPGDAAIRYDTRLAPKASFTTRRSAFTIFAREVPL